MENTDQQRIKIKGCLIVFFKSAWIFILIEFIFLIKPEVDKN